MGYRNRRSSLYHGQFTTGLFANYTQQASGSVPMVDLMIDMSGTFPIIDLIERWLKQRIKWLKKIKLTYTRENSSINLWKIVPWWSNRAQKHGLNRMRGSIYPWKEPMQIDRLIPSSDTVSIVVGGWDRSEDDYSSCSLCDPNFFNWLEDKIVAASKWKKDKTNGI